MQFFSQRKGLKPVKSIIQKDNMDDDLRNGIWNVFYDFLTTRIHIQILEFIIQTIWTNYYKNTIDTFPRGELTYVFRGFYFEATWNEVYDLIEIVVLILSKINYDQVKDDLIIDINNVLQKEVSAYRIANGTVTSITSSEEIDTIESALKTPINPVQSHLQQALVLFSDRQNPDYPNSMKESISAVEALCKLITSNPKATLGDALKEIEKSNIVNLHPALKDAYLKLYGYTNDAGGIRHAKINIDEPNVDAEDARFMLVTCSAFVNYLTEKAQKAGLKL